MSTEPLVQGFRTLSLPARPLAVRIAECLAAVLLITAVAGPGWFGLGWSLLICGVLSPARSTVTGAVVLFLCGLSALIGPTSASWGLLASAGVLMTVDGETTASRLIPGAVLPAALLAGDLTGLQAAAVAVVVSGFLSGRMHRILLCAAGLLAGVFLFGPPRPSAEIRDYPEHVSQRYVLFDWHDDVSINLGKPSVVFHAFGPWGEPFPMTVEADIPEDGSMIAFIIQGDTLVPLQTGTSELVLPYSPKPIELHLQGEWRPFSAAEVAVTWMGGATE